MIHSFPKIFHVGDPKVSNLFNGPVEVTEKVDGSQFVFGKVNGELVMRSKGAPLYRESTEKLFLPAISHILAVEHIIPDGMVFYAETLCRPKHNCLVYDRTPKNNIAVFGCMEAGSQRLVPAEEFSVYAEAMDVDTVPVLYVGDIQSADEVKSFLDRESYLGSQKVEGVVVKNYTQELFLGGNVFYVLSGKYVSEAFKEVHRATWKGENTGKGKFELFCDSYRTPARWNKAALHLDERGELELSPRDIGKLIKEVQADITEEEKENIKERLWEMFGKDVLRVSIHGLPEWYKQKLIESAFKADAA